LAAALSLSTGHDRMMIIYATLAQAAAPGVSGSTLSGIVFQVVVIIGIIYFIMIRPQQKQRQKHEAALRGLKKGDEIVTSGGIIGKVVFIKESTKDGQPLKAMDDRVTIESGESRIVVERGKIGRVGGGPAPNANA